MKKKIIIAIIVLACIGGAGSVAYYYSNNGVEVKASQALKNTEASTTLPSTKDSTTKVSTESSATASNSSISSSSAQAIQAISESSSNDSASCSTVSSQGNTTTTSQTNTQGANSSNIEQMYEQETKNHVDGVMYMGDTPSYTTTESTGYTIDGKINGIPYTNIQNGTIYDTNAVIQVGNFGGLYDITSDSGYAYIYYQPNINSELLAKVTNYFQVFIKGCYGNDWYCVEVFPSESDGSSKEIIGFVKACYLTSGIQTNNEGSITYL